MFQQIHFLTSPGWVKLAIIFALACFVICRRTRPIGLSIIGLLICALFFWRASAASDGQSAAMFAQQQAVAVKHARAQAEITKNQRLASRGADATVQEGFAGTELETYPDGMQIQELAGGLRQIVRPADPVPDTEPVATFEYHAIGPKGFSLFLLPASITAVIMFVMIARRRRVQTDEPKRSWAPASAALLAVVAIGLVGLSLTRPKPMVATAIPQSPLVTASQPQGGESVDAQWERLNQSRIVLTTPSLPSAPASNVSPPVVKYLPPAPAAAQASSSTDQSESIRAVVQSLGLSAQIADYLKDQADGAETEAPEAKTDPSAAILSDALSAILSTADGLSTVASDPGSRPLVIAVVVDSAGRLIATAANQPIGGVKSRMKSALPALALRAASAVSTTTAAKELATAPLAAEQSQAGPRPDWVDRPAKVMGDRRQFVLTAGPYTTIEECRRSLEESLKQSVIEHIGHLAAAETGSPNPYVPYLETMHLDFNGILSKVYKDEYPETVDTSVGEMKKAYFLGEFSSAEDKELLAAWQGYARRNGVTHMAVIAVGAVGLLAIVFSLLKLDTWTRGYYTKRLFLGVPAVIIAVVMLIGLLS